MHDLNVFASMVTESVLGQVGSSNACLFRQRAIKVSELFHIKDSINAFDIGGRRNLSCACLSLFFLREKVLFFLFYYKFLTVFRSSLSLEDFDFGLVRFCLLVSSAFSPHLVFVTFLRSIYFILFYLMVGVLSCSQFV